MLELQREWSLATSCRMDYKGEEAKSRIIVACYINTVIYVYTPCLVMIVANKLRTLRLKLGSEIVVLSIQDGRCEPMLPIR